MKRRFALLLSLAMVAASAASAATSTPADTEPQADWISPSQAIEQAAAAAPGVVSGTFAMKVLASGRDRTQLFLNSEISYRDPRNVSVALTPRAAAHLRERLGSDPASALKGKRILVHSAAVRVRIDWFLDGKKTGQYYYQTQIPVLNGDQITVLESADLTDGSRATQLPGT